MSIFDFFRRKPSKLTSDKALAANRPATSTQKNTQQSLDIRRHFYNEQGFQCYASFFAYWEGWIGAGHCLTDTHDLLPPFARGKLTSWPGGLDAALMGCRLPRHKPAAPIIGQRVIMKGFPAGARTMETRRGHVYIERGAGSGTWIAHIETPDEPVVTGMSGGPVVDVDSGEPIGIIITRNSPADLNNDRDPDESCDFIALSEVWETVSRGQNMS